MRIAIASGKGGVGKTTVAVALAFAAAEQGRAVAYADCDVEAPNGHLLLRPIIDRRETVSRPIPEVDLDRCVYCTACEQACEFGAIVCLNDVVRVNADLCKSCGACVLACPNRAIREVERAIGDVAIGRVGGLAFLQGGLHLGQPRGVPVIEAVKRAIPHDVELAILDAPPGTSCPMAAAIRDADFVVLVAEATAFGLADLQVAIEAVQAIGVPTGVIVNRSDIGDERVQAFCRARQIPILAEIPYSRDLAMSYANGSLQHVIDALNGAPARILDRLSVASTRAC